MFKKPWLWLPAKWAHDLSPLGLKLVSFVINKKTTPAWNSIKYKNLNFKNPLGLAGGVDKNGTQLIEWQNLGAGFIEVGTITPNPQSSNPGHIIQRDLKTKSLWNKMGFPSNGKDIVLKNIIKTKEKLNIPLFINIGKNRTTKNENAADDYSLLMKDFFHLADAFVINISSPNTQNLRELLEPKKLHFFLKNLTTSYQTLVTNSAIAPLILIKLSPDIDDILIEQTLEICFQHNIDGFILTNTTLNRSTAAFYPVEGGLSGLPLKDQSLHLLRKTVHYCQKMNTKKMVVSVGGVMTADDVFERISLGADLVQVYSALVFEGPLFFRKVEDIAIQRAIQGTN